MEFYHTFSIWTLEPSVQHCLITNHFVFNSDLFPFHCGIFHRFEIVELDRCQFCCQYVANLTQTIFFCIGINYWLQIVTGFDGLKVLMMLAHYNFWRLFTELWSVVLYIWQRCWLRVLKVEDSTLVPLVNIEAIHLVLADHEDRA